MNPGGRGAWLLPTFCNNHATCVPVNCELETGPGPGPGNKRTTLKVYLY